MRPYIVFVFVCNNASKYGQFVKSTDTLRKTLEDNNINYKRGITMLDGSTLRPEELDKTYEQHGIKSRCYLLNYEIPGGG